MTASRRRTQTKDSRGGGSDGKTCSLPNGIRTAPVTSDVVASSRGQPNQRAHSTNAGTVTTTHGLPTRIAPNARAGPVPFACEAAQPPKPLTRVGRNDSSLLLTVSPALVFLKVIVGEVLLEYTLEVQRGGLDRP